MLFTSLSPTQNLMFCNPPFRQKFTPICLGEALPPLLNMSRSPGDLKNVIRYHCSRTLKTILSIISKLFKLKSFET